MVLADTGFFIALANRSDQDHEAATRAARTVRGPFMTTWPVLTETTYLLARRLGFVAQQRFLDAVIAGAVTIFPLGPEHLPRTRALMETYRALPMDLADASLVIAAESLGNGDIVSTDRRDFGTYRWKERHPFRNLLALARPRRR